MEIIKRLIYYLLVFFNILAYSRESITAISFQSLAFSCFTCGGLESNLILTNGIPEI